MEDYVPALHKFQNSMRVKNLCAEGETKITNETIPEKAVGFLYYFFKERGQVKISIKAMNSAIPKSDEIVQKFIYRNQGEFYIHRQDKVE